MKNFSLSSNKRAAAGEFSSFCRQMDFLSRTTGLFMTDAFGNIINSRHIDTEKDSFPVLCDMVDNNDYDNFLSNRHTTNAFVMCKKNSDGKDFIISLPYKGGFTKGVLLKCGDKNFTTLSDYYIHLCTYRDYLFSLSSLSFSPNSEKAVSMIFDMKLSGVLHLLNLSEFQEQKQTFLCPVIPFVQKVQNLALGIGRSLTVTGNIGANVFINTSYLFLKMLISCTALCLRKTDEDILLNITDDKGNLTFCFELSDCTGKSFDIYESNIINSLKINGADFKIYLKDGKYRIILHHECIKRDKMKLYERDDIEKALTDFMEDMSAKNLFSCIALK